ncbi:hypothetical protein RO3G_15881 [Rhizopus delemar RA 99-880]|uniref:Uncharacterized protein n=1 Tax=Rhizopus delemar (strain RA 99-880 / ATCC MYA-4621 / FGSC 9543 / NRRL 43880) TaxID=246409 RepID=I1CRU0_RHIO9|nr:hypothetical protein RO3G_09922 [Rhizopus delemar RA 99-880]EIE85236.1 hypothetical protein RO3G_09946 [Rhizopus delemar RA 99-880]EIE91170.1 hypothetical protein RO3G_15881 [Rhizopus delemar RA 99-880]|eukprot:EIE85212.1 hypothetical protein RO3G_09922 [Rhizopus delemar RA 99-880]
MGKKLVKHYQQMNQEKKKKEKKTRHPCLYQQVKEETTVVLRKRLYKDHLNHKESRQYDFTKIKKKAQALVKRIPNGTHSDDEHESHEQSCSFQHDEAIRITDFIVACY